MHTLRVVKSKEVHMGRALVTFARSWPALAVTRSLGRRGIEVYCGDEAPFAAAFFSKYCRGSFRYPSPQRDPQGFLSSLEQEVKRLKPADNEPYVLLPVHNETFLIARERRRFEPYISMALPPYEKTELTHDKGALAGLARKLEIPIPPTYTFHSLEDLYRAVPDLSFPLFVKLRQSASGVGVKKCRTPEELVATFKFMIERYGLGPEEYPLVQTFVAGQDYCVTALFQNGRFVAGMTYRNVRSFPRGTGAGALRETVDLPEAEAHTRRLLEHLSWHGIAEVDWRVDPQGKAFLIEINPRLFGGLPQAVASNVDYPYLLFRIACGEHVTETPRVSYDVRTEAPVVGLLSTLEEIAHDERLLERLKLVAREFKALGRTPIKDLRLKPLWEALRAAAHTRDIRRIIHEAFEKHADAINDVLQAEDPAPVLGLLFPLVLMLKHGKLSLALVTGESDPDRGRPTRRFRDFLRRPRWRAILLAGFLFTLSVLAKSAPFTRDNIGWVLALPLEAAQAVFGRLSELRTDTLGGALRYTACNALHLFFWYLLAALLLRRRSPRRPVGAER